jgi:hypothetical protein
MLKVHNYLRWSRTNPFVNIVFDNGWIIGHTQYLKHSIVILNFVPLFLNYKYNTFSLNRLKSTGKIFRRNMLQNEKNKINRQTTSNRYVIQNRIKIFHTGFLRSTVAMGSITWSNDSTNVERLPSSITNLTLNLT